MVESYGEAARMSQSGDRVRPLLRVRQVREFTDATVNESAPRSLASVGRQGVSALTGPLV
jgi:hypothetical protein